MAKLKSPKPNILERLRVKKLPSYARSNPETKFIKDKGLYLGSCNRSACLRPGANWFNHSTQKYYCEECAEWLNTDNFNKADAMTMWGHNLCTAGEYSASTYQKLHDLHRNANLRNWPI